MKFKALLIGLGNVGMLYDKDNFKNQSICLSHTKALHYSQKFDLIGGIDLNKNNRDIFAKLTKIKPYDSLKSFQSHNKYVDLIIVATPTATHFQIIDKIIHNIKPKAILCEKPLSYSLEESNEIINICKKHKVELFINFPRRVETSISVVKKLIGKLSYFKGVVWYSNGAINNGIHFIDLITFLVGTSKKIDLISLNHKYKERDDFDADFKITYDKGEVYFLSWSEKLYSNYKIELYSKELRFTYDNNGFKTKLNKVIKDPNYIGYKCLSTEEQIIENDLDFSINYVYNDVLNYLEKNNKESFLNDSNQMKSVHQIIDKLKKMIN